MATSARNRKKREARGSFYSWENQEKEKKAQKTLDNYKEEDNEQR